MNSHKILFDDTKTEITHIYHISDICIGPDERYNEYMEVLANLTNILKTKPESSILVVTGNVLCDYSCMSHRAYFVLMKLLEINSIMPIIIISGCGDIDTNSNEKKNFLAFLLEKEKTVYYLHNSGLYQYQNILFSVASICDNYFYGRHPQYIDNIKQKNKHNVLLAYYEPTEKSDKISLIKSFSNKFMDDDFPLGNISKGYDHVMLGGSNKHMRITNSIAYAGPLLQQDHVNNTSNHGVLEWNLVSGKNKLIPVKNNYEYCTIHVNDTIQEIPQKPHIIFQLDADTRNKIINHISKKYNIPELKNKEVRNISFDLI